MLRHRVFAVIGLLAFVAFSVVLPATTAVAQTKVEICNNGVDDDDNKLTDCADPACTETEFCKNPPPPKKDADCSPGFYKKHPNTWDDGICAAGDAKTAGTESNQLFRFLSAELGATAAQRALAKGFLDTCFATAELSPCEDDD
jgi:hypothetical protein